MSVTDRYLEFNATYQPNRTEAMPLLPSSQMAIVACMDARLNVRAILGMADGEAHVLRNAGGVVTEDVLRSLIISQRLLGTNEIILIHHTGCGMMRFTGDALRDEIEAETGERPHLRFHTFKELETDLRDGMRAIRTNKFLPHRNVRAFICDLDTGRLHEVFE